MRTILEQVLVGLAVTSAVGVLGALGWSGYLMGAALAVALWVMLAAGSRASGVSTPDLLAAGVLGVLLGFLMFQLGGSAVWWAVGFIMAGLLYPSVRRAGSRSQ